jgi:anti-sigma factor RsiW
MLTNRTNHRADNPADKDNPFPVAPFAAAPSDADGSGDDCTRTAANLAAYLDEELDMNQRRAVESHLNLCAACASTLDALRRTDTFIQREWRDTAPLPSSSEQKRAIDSIMAALPPVPAAPAAFAPKRVHARTRWIRFSTGLTGLIALLGLLWSSYRLGYEHGRMSVRSASIPPTNVPVSPASGSRLTPIVFSPPTLFLAKPSSPPSIAPGPSLRRRR